MCLNAYAALLFLFKRAIAVPHQLFKRVAGYAGESLMKR
jgi:hypothetical protein